MTEIILTNKKHGMPVLLLTILVYILAVAGTIYFAMAAMVAPMVVCIVILCLGWLTLPGLKVLGPQEALVLTLFGNYIGTLKGEGFYFVNPFCTAVNPAAKTQMNQSPDIEAAKGGGGVLAALAGGSSGLPKEAVNKKISLKIMTLSNARQKINDCLGNPVEIGIAVTWRVVDTAKAVFDVDNFKEFLSLQCDTACGTSSGSTPMTWHPAGRPATTRRASGAPAKWWPPGSRKSSRPRSPRPGWRSSRPGSPTWPTPRRLPRPCSSGSRPAPSSTPGR